MGRLALITFFLGRPEGDGKDTISLSELSSLPLCLLTPFRGGEGQYMQVVSSGRSSR